MSVINVNDTSAAWNERAKQRALDTYAQLVPVAKNTYAQMVPMARNAGLASTAHASGRRPGWNRPASRCAIRSGRRSRTR
jgi:hypothetical protein